MDTKLIQNDVMIANFEADPEKRNKIFKNEIQVYTKEHELDLEQHK
jgi:replication fork clamp-binding protein CrfC